MGSPSDPVTLHKYAYGNVDPANHTDTSGHFGFMEFGAANNIAMELMSLQVDVGTSLLDVAFSGPQAPASVASGAALGFGAVLLGNGSFKLLKLMSKKARAFFTARGLDSCSVGCLNKLKGVDWEEFLNNTIGGRGNFKSRTPSSSLREFDGGTDSMWWEAKSSWHTISTSPRAFSDFKSTTGAQMQIARYHGVEFRIITNQVIPDNVRSWLESRNIAYHELVN